MSGHSKWNNIRRKKGAADLKRGKVFTKAIREIQTAARLGGGNPEGNPRLRLAMEKAREANMPMENIKRAILKGTGQLQGETYEEVVYEGFGPGGVAILVEAMTDNRQRTVAEIRNVFSKLGGNLGEAGSVSWMFKKRGRIQVDKGAISEDELLSVAMDAGADDLSVQDAAYEVTTEPALLDKVRSALQARKIAVQSAELTMVPQTSIHLEGEKAVTMLKLMEALDDLDDVQRVHANFDIPDEILESAAA